MPRRRDFGFGWRPSPPDQRDHKLPPPGDAPLPRSVDLRKRVDPKTGAPLLGKAWQQGRLGSCQTHAALKAWYYLLGVEGLRQIMPSRLFVYFNARDLEGTTDSNVGAYTRDAVAAIARFGAPAERLWPYRQDEFAQRPPQLAYDRAERRVALEYLAVDQDVTAIKASLAAGFPVIVGFTMYGDSMPTKDNGYFQPLPGRRASVIGRHAVLVVGYTTVNRRPAWIILDSDGTWLNDGYWFMDLRYLANPDLAADFWTLRKVGHAPA